jgi:alginate O-acetyltransferase complex protein AlgI
MDLLSPIYVGFILVAAFLFHVCPDRWRSRYLAAVSLIFYCFFSVVAAAIMLVLALATWLAGRFVANRGADRKATATVWAVVLAEVGYLVFLKAVPLWGIAGSSGTLARFLVGFGASYYTFKLVGYLLDVYWSRGLPIREFSRLLAITAFFPQLPAGPIQRAGEFGWVRDATELPALMTTGFRRILLGFVKKMAFADPLGAMVTMIAAGGHQWAGQQWILFYLYPVQLYADFSALTDIAVGAAALFGIRSPENFALPFFASSITQFWRRWHMTLTRWLTDYVFTPLRLATRDLGDWGLSFSLALNMMLIALWHGFRVGFVLFGAIHSVYLIADALSGPLRRKFYKAHPSLDRMMDFVGPVLLYNMVALTLVFFRDGTLAGGLFTLRHLFTGMFHPAASLTALMYGFGRLRSLCAFIALAGLAFLDLGALLRATAWRSWFALPRFVEFPRPLRWACYCAAIVAAIMLHRQSAQFIYVQF